MKTVAYSCPFVPPEWIAAHGLHPCRLVPSKTDGAAVLPGLCPYAAAFAREAAESAVTAMVFTTACDQMRRISERSAKPAFLMHVPTTWQSPAAQALYRDELRRLGRFLESLGGIEPSPERLREVLRTYDAARLREAGPGFSEKQLKPATRIPLLLLGGPMPPGYTALLDHIDRAGGAVAVNGLETGERTWPAPWSDEALERDPFKAMAGAYFAIPDAFRRPNTLLYEWLHRIIAARAIRGILLHRFPWCDTWHAEARRIRDCSGLPLLELEAEGGMGALERQTGRIEAFLEMLRC